MDFVSEIARIVQDFSYTLPADAFWTAFRDSFWASFWPAYWG